METRKSEKKKLLYVSVHTDITAPKRYYNGLRLAKLKIHIKLNGKKEIYHINTPKRPKHCTVQRAKVTAIAKLTTCLPTDWSHSEKKF